MMPGSQQFPALPDAGARQRALLDYNATLLIEAGAGSGKTALMAGRVALMLAHGIRPRDIVAITFTEAAVAELLERISARPLQRLQPLWTRSPAQRSTGSANIL
jgi:ATP-dependent exoDNAse (exonuclease V) beta subunit